MSTFRQFWGKLFSKPGTPSEADGQPTVSPEDLEREIAAVSGENQALSEEVQRVRTDFERAKEEEERKIVDLERVHQAMELARSEEHRKLAELESLNNRIESARDADSRKIHDLESQLAALECERDKARDKAKALENSLLATTTQLEKTDLQIKDLQSNTVEQARQFKTSLTEASNRLESTDNNLRELEQRLRNDRQDYLKTYQDMQVRLRKQDSRMTWTVTAAGFALLLGTVAGAVLIWDVQRNATLLSGMSKDLKDLMGSIDGHLSLQHEPQEGKQQVAQPVIPPTVSATTVAEPPQESTAPKPVPAATSETVSKSAPNPYFLGNAFKDRGRPTTRDGKQDPTRDHANSFFEDNAKLEGVVNLPSGVQYRVVAPGSGKSPLLSDKIKVAYVGIKLDGTIFDETHSSGEPSTFSMSEVLPAWQEVLLKMEEGAEFELYAPPELSTKGGVRKRGVLGYEPSIYLIELLEVVRDDATAPAAPTK